LANIIQKHQGKTNHKLTLRWVARHEGIKGNKIVENATNGRTLGKPSLPAYLRKVLPLNPAALRQHHNAKLITEWTTDWKDSKRGKDFLRLDKTMPSPSFLKQISNPSLS
jgi:hypothetical protein